MGLEKRESGKYITIYQGKFCIRVPEGTEGSVERVNKLGNKVSEMFYDSFNGVLTNIKTKDSADYGKNWEFTLVDGEDQYTLQLSYSNSFAKNILKMLPNVDLSKPMTLSPSMKMEDGKQKTSLFINQDGKAIKHAYTKDVPNGLPPMEKIKVKGQDMWDDSASLAFLQEMVDTQILPKLAGYTTKAYTGSTESQDDGDAPF